MKRFMGPSVVTVLAAMALPACVALLATDIVARADVVPIPPTDGVGPYQTSGCLIGDRILGQTWAEHRKFVLNWIAERE